VTGDSMSEDTTEHGAIRLEPLATNFVHLSIHCFEGLTALASGRWEHLGQCKFAVMEAMAVSSATWPLSRINRNPRELRNPHLAQVHAAWVYPDASRSFIGVWRR
jgi:hypothetical protein